MSHCGKGIITGQQLVASQMTGSLRSQLPTMRYGLPSGILFVATSATGHTSSTLIVSLSGLSLPDNLEMVDRVSKTEGIAAIELNLACPNNHTCGNRPHTISLFT